VSDANADAESDTLKWCGVCSRGERGWRPEQARPVGEKKRVTAIGDRGWS